MGLFGRPRDHRFFDAVINEVIEKVVEVQVIYYELDEKSSNVNVYNEATVKIYKPPKPVFCLLTYQDIMSMTDDFGVDINSNLILRFHHTTLKKVDILPKSGDIVKWNNYYFEIDTLIQGYQYPGRESPFVNFIVSSHMTRQSKILVKDYLTGEIKEEINAYYRPEKPKT